MRRILILGVLTGCLFFSFLQAWAGDNKEPTMAEVLQTAEILRQVFSKDERSPFIDKEKILSFLEKEYGVTREDEDFILSIRSARLAYDGSDFFRDPGATLQLAEIYRDARARWGKPVTKDFYEFFGKVADEKAKKGGKWAEGFFQIQAAKEKFR